MTLNPFTPPSELDAVEVEREATSVTCEVSTSPTLRCPEVAAYRVTARAQDDGESWWTCPAHVRGLLDSLLLDLITDTEE